MSTFLRRCFASIFAVSLSLATASVFAQAKTVTIGYQEYALPMRLLNESRALEASSGYAVKWRKFDTGADVAKALSAGEIQIGDLGSSPLTNAIGNGSQIELFWISDAITDSEALIARKGSGIEKWGDLVGKTVAVPHLSNSHFQLFARLATTGRGSRVKVVFMTPPEIREAWEKKAIDVAFIWNPVLSHLKESGNVLVTSGEIAKYGFPTFDGLALHKAWGKANETFVVAFVKELLRVNKLYDENKGKWTASSPEVIAIAKHAASDPEQILPAMAQNQFLNAEQQLSSFWMGSGAATTMTDTALFVMAMGLGQPPKIDFREFVNTDYLKKALTAVP